MPGFDKTGPRGMGSMTGGGRGYCAVPAGDGFLGRARAGGFGRPSGTFGCGRGRGGPGMGRRAFGGYLGAGMAGPAFSAPAMTEEQELASLRQQAQSIQGELEQIQHRIGELDQ